MTDKEFIQATTQELETISDFMYYIETHIDSLMNELKIATDHSRIKELNQTIKDLNQELVKYHMEYNKLANEAYEGLGHNFNDIPGVIHDKNKKYSSI